MFQICPTLLLATAAEVYPLLTKRRDCRPSGLCGIEFPKSYLDYGVGWVPGFCLGYHLVGLWSRHVPPAVYVTKTADGGNGGPRECSNRLQNHQDNGSASKPMRPVDYSASAELVATKSHTVASDMNFLSYSGARASFPPRMADTLGSARLFKSRARCNIQLYT